MTKEPSEEKLRAEADRFRERQKKREQRQRGRSGRQVVQVETDGRAGRGVARGGEPHGRRLVSA